MSTKLNIKNMVCNRCIKVVNEELTTLGHKLLNISLGEVELDGKLNKNDLEKIKIVLEENGFELLEDKNKKLVESIKQLIIKKIYDEKPNWDENISSYLSKNLDKDYISLSSLFSSIENITIEHYLILQKIERVKELLKYDELTLSEISYQLGYSSVQHLSNQFRKATGMSASDFKKNTSLPRKPIDKTI